MATYTNDQIALAWQNGDEATLRAALVDNGYEWADPAKMVPRAVADDVVNAIEAELPLLREARDGRQTAVDEPLGRYREAVATEA